MSKIIEVMSKPVVWISPDASIEEAARKMEEFKIGDLPVCVADDRLLGMLTDRDIVVRAIAQNRDPKTTQVKEIMTHGGEWCFEDDDLWQIINRMEARGIRRMIVFDHNKKLIGLVSLADIAVKGNETLAGEALHHIAELRRSRQNMNIEDV